MYVGKDGYLFEKFEYGEDEENHLKRITAVVNKFANNVDIPVYFMLIPNSIYIHQDKLPNNVEVPNQRKIIENWYASLNEKITPVEVTSILEACKEQYTYFKTDHHMTTLGAYLVYAKMCLTMDKTPTTVADTDYKTVSTTFLGTFDSKAQIRNQETDRISIFINEKNTDLKEVQYDKESTRSIYNTEYLTQKDKYSFFLNGNNAKVVVKTKVENGKKLLIIKDSYAHIMAQFLCQDYEELHFIDPRYYKASLSQYAKENAITEVLFIYNLSNLVNDLGLPTLS